MNTSRADKSFWVAVICCTLARFSTLALDPNLPPGSNFDLSHWYLGLPVDSLGGTNGSSASIPALQLVAGYSNASYFYTGADGAMVFWAPVTGATTSGSSYPRSELREQIKPPSNGSNWFGFGTHILDAQCRVIEVPATKKVIIGQIHGYTGDARPLLKLQYNNWTIEALVKTNSSFDGDWKFTYANVGLSNNINYQIKVVDGLLSTTVNGTTKSTNIFLNDSDWDTNTLYFKAGSYCQDNDGPTNEGARVAFYSVSVSHAPSITSQPADCPTLQGSNATFNVSASGNGTLRYQWQFNTTNVLSNATNASLTVTNVQSHDAGGYSVKVTDGLGSVTSLVATLTVLVPASANVQPSGQTVISGSDATFAANASGSEPLSYQWYFNTNTPLIGATNDLLVLTNVGIDDAGVYSVIVSNAVGVAPGSFATLWVNRPPCAGRFATVTGQQVPVSISTATLLALASDADGDAVNLAGASPESVQGGTVVLTGEMISYTPPPGFVGADQWSYVLIDARGADTNGTVNVAVLAADTITLNPVEQHLHADGSFSAVFEGVPGLRYVVDRATNATGPWELNYTNVLAGTNALFEFTDLNVPAQFQRFYRARYP